MADRGGTGGRRRYRPTFALKIAVLVIIVVAVPMIVYQQLRAADAERSALLLANLQQQGRLIAESIRPALENQGIEAAPRLNERLARLVGDDPDIGVKVLFRPDNDTAQGAFFFVAAWPAVSTTYLEEERARLLDTGIFDRVRDSCAGHLPLARRFTNPGGERELLASLSPVDAPSGCWVVLTAYHNEQILRSSIGRPYWRTPEVQVAALIYVAMALFVISLFANAWRNLRRFAGLARRIRRGGARVSFRRRNRMPELDGVAAEFDGMVQALRDSADFIRQTAQENAHTLKAPVAVIAQAIEPIKRAVPEGDTRARRAIDMIEQSTARLDSLVSAARRLDELAAETLNPESEMLDVSVLLERILDGYAEAWSHRSLTLDHRVEPGLVTFASSDLLETAFENILENAASFSPPGGCIRVTAERRDDAVEVRFDDEGPGVSIGILQRIFERYVSERGHEPDPRARTDDTHYGIGLWMVRRNVEALGGTAWAENREEGGLRVVIRLPLDRGGA